MDIGLNILSNLRISIGEDVNDIIKSLNDNNIKYSIPYRDDETNINGNIILFIETYGVELSTSHGKVEFIKSGNSALNYIMEIGMNTPALVLMEIREKLANNFNVDVSKIRVDRFEAKSFNSIMSIPYEEGRKVKINLVLGIRRGIYIETMRVVDI
jgi:hypothetical protein